MPLYRLSHAVTVAECLRRAASSAVIVGDPERLVSGFSPLDEAEPGALCFCSVPREEAPRLIAACPAAAVIVQKELARAPDFAAGRTLVLASDPTRLFVECIHALIPAPRETGVMAGARVAADASLAPGVFVEAGAVIDAGCSVGADCSIHSGVRLYPRTQIGRGSLLQSNVVVGASGMAYAEGPDGFYLEFPHLGGVTIGERVAIGANSTIVRGILTDTVVGDGTKIGNQVNIGHNVKIGRHCFISSGITLCGSATIGDRCWVGAGAVVLNHVRVGDGAKLTAGAVVTRNVAPGSLVAGVPARAVPGPLQREGA